MTRPSDTSSGLRPAGMSAATFARALRALEQAVGAEHVFAAENDRYAYADHFAGDESLHQPCGAVAPANTAEVQAVLRIANEFGLPLWTISRGKNFGYGGPAPALKGSMVLDLSRMKRFTVDRENGTVLVEPGVGFYDLYDYLQREKIPLWLSVPGNSWGSVAGNALDRGVGYTTYGDHAARICGLEVVLPEGDVVRTGMGAMSGSPNWQLYRPGFGPSWDAMFCQSNFGVVTQMGLWLMPAPETMLALDYEFDQPEDLGWVVDTLAPLRREGVIQQSPSIGNWLRAAAVMTTRNQWTNPVNYQNPPSPPSASASALAGGACSCASMGAKKSPPPASKWWNALLPTSPCYRYRSRVGSKAMPPRKMLGPARPSVFPWLMPTGMAAAVATSAIHQYCRRVATWRWTNSIAPRSSMRITAWIITLASPWANATLPM